MHAPNRANQVISPSRREFYAGFCRSGCPFNGEGGWFVPYRRVPEFNDAYEAVITLNVIDLSSTFIGEVPFVIDTGSDVTIIPRRLVGGSNASSASNAFQQKAIGDYYVQGLTGKVVVGRRYRASLFVPLPRQDVSPLSFGEVKLVVVEEWMGKYAVLGLDALRQVVMVSDRDHISLWPRPARACELPTKVIAEAS